MRKYLLLFAVLLLASCSSNEKLTVYDVKPLHGGDSITVVKGDNVGVTLHVGDTIIVNLEDSEIISALREDRLFVDSAEYNYKIVRHYQIDKL